MLILPIKRSEFERSIGIIFFCDFDKSNSMTWIGCDCVRLMSIKSLFAFACFTTGYPGSVIVPQYGSSKITVFVWGKKLDPKICRKY